MWRYALIVLSAACFVSAANADVLTGNDLLKSFDRATDGAKHTFGIAISNEYDGIAWTNSYLQQNGPGLFCPPTKVNLVYEQLLDILRKSIEANPRIGEAPYGLAMLLAAIHTFPCKKN